MAGLAQGVVTGDPADPMARWRGSVFARPGGRLYVKIRVGPGRWRNVPTPYREGQEHLAEAMQLELAARAQATEEAGAGAPLTVRVWADRWLKGRADEAHDRGRLERHVLPRLGSLLLEEVRPRHVLELVQRKDLAPRTIRNVYSLVRALFRDAAISDLVTGTPCILGKAHLPSVEDRDAEWRAVALFSRSELETLISPNEAIEPDSTVQYALLGLGMMRPGEVAGLRWRHYAEDVQPLGRLTVAGSYARRGTKTVLERWMPVHPTLAAILADWRLSGWERYMGRAPKPDDWIVPAKEDEAHADRPERFRARWFTDSRIRRHLKALGWRSRRAYDLRRTGISFAREDGARADILKRGTHAAPREVIELYTSVEWRLLCEQVECLRVRRAKPAKVRRIR